MRGRISGKGLMVKSKHRYSLSVFTWTLALCFPSCCFSFCYFLVSGFVLEHVNEPGTPDQAFVQSKHFLKSPWEAFGKRREHLEGDWLPIGVRGGII